MADLRAAEALRAKGLTTTGHLVRLWRPIGETHSIGPLVATPLLHDGNHQALLLAAAIVLAAAITAPAPPSRHRLVSRTPPHRTPAELVE